MPTFEGPQHPLTRDLRHAEIDAENAWAHLPDAVAIVQHHRDHSVSTQSVYRLDIEHGAWTGDWDYLGPGEETRHLLTTGPEYIEVIDGITTPAKLIHHIYAKVLDHRDRSRKAVRAAEELAHPAAWAIGLALAGGDLDWDTGESVAAAARRVALDIIQDHPSYSTEQALNLLCRRLGLPQQTPNDAAAAYLERRPDIAAALRAGRGLRGAIPWGGEMLNSRRAAEAAGVGRSTWRAYVSRGQAPRWDELDTGAEGLWREATVAAWRQTRTRTAPKR